MDAFQLITQFSKLSEFAEKDDIYNIEGGVDMCKAIKDMMEDSRLEVVERGIQGMIRICKEFGVSKEITLGKIIAELSLPEEKANEYLQRYWGHLIIDRNAVQEGTVIRISHHSS